MVYPSFLSIISQFSESQKAHVSIEGRILYVEKLEGQWVFSTKILTPDEEVLSCFSSTGAFQFLQGGVLLKLDSSTKAVYAVQKVQLPDKKYIPFKQSLIYFLEVVSQYEEIFSFANSGSS